MHVTYTGSTRPDKADIEAAVAEALAQPAPTSGWRIEGRHNPDQDWVALTVAPSSVDADRILAKLRGQVGPGQGAEYRAIVFGATPTPVYVETLYHYRCGRCKLYWTIADIPPAIDAIAQCPHCHNLNQITELTQGVPPEQAKQSSLTRPASIEVEGVARERDSGAELD